MSERERMNSPHAEYEVGEKVEILLDSSIWGNLGWLSGTVVSIEPYSSHRSFYWVQLDPTNDYTAGTAGLISVLNPKKIRRVIIPSSGEEHGTSPG